MTTTLVCPCGMRLNAPGATPGRKGRCPACGTVLQVPVQPPRRPGKTASPAADSPPSEGAPTDRHFLMADPAAQSPPCQGGGARSPSRPLTGPLPGSDPPAPPLARGGKTRNNPARKRDGPSAEGTPTAAGGYSIQPSSRERTPSAFVSRRPDVKSPPGGRSADLPDRLGLVRAPEQPERSLLISLLYPFWDGGGIALLVLMAPVLCVTSLCVFGLIPLVIRGGNMLVMGPFAFPMVLIFALALGFVLQVLEQFLVASAAGEVSHPRWPNVNFFGILGCLVRWLGAGALGVLPAFILATVAWWDGESVSVLACAKTAGLIAVGAVYSLMALVAIVLHDDLRAASPLIVLRAVALTGGPYLRSCLLAGLAAGAPLVLLAMILRMEDFWLIVAATWLFWVVALYGVLVVLRVLGLAYHRRAQDLGWFPERPRWGAGTSVRR